LFKVCGKYYVIVCEIYFHYISFVLTTTFVLDFSFFFTPAC
jgi:hypothetical protein